MKELNRFRKFLTEDKKSISGGMLLSENAPGYDDRKFGNPLPTLESVQAAHEAKKDEEVEDHKHTYKQIDPDGTAECTKCGLRNSDPSKTGEKVRTGVKSAAEKLGMKPSHIKENSFGAAGTDKRSGQVIGDILQLIRDTGIDPMDVLEEIGQEFGISFEFGR
tara:strand:+ start:41 stop:529 length:489 start_codon:yes stop_codon:yes gene_type:complete